MLHNTHSHNNTLLQHSILNLPQILHPLIYYILEMLPHLSSAHLQESRQRLMMYSHKMRHNKEIQNSLQEFLIMILLQILPWLIQYTLGMLLLQSFVHLQEYQQLLQDTYKKTLEQLFSVVIPYQILPWLIQYTLGMLLIQSFVHLRESRQRLMMYSHKMRHLKGCNHLQQLSIENYFQILQRPIWYNH